MILLKSLTQFELRSSKQNVGFLPAESDLTVASLLKVVVQTQKNFAALWSSRTKDAKSVINNNFCWYSYSTLFSSTGSLSTEGSPIGHFLFV